MLFNMFIFSVGQKEDKIKESMELALTQTAI